MFPPWRFKLREAQVALDQGRLEEAARLVGDPTLEPFLPVQQLQVQIATQMARRALERAAAGDIPAGWHDLQRARELSGETADWLNLRQAVAEVAVGDVVHHLKAGDIARRHVANHGPRATQNPWHTAHFTSGGDAQARFCPQTQPAGQIRRGPGATFGCRNAAAGPLASGRSPAAMRRARRAARALLEQLHAATAASDWTKLLALANELLEIAPENRVARDARKRAWAEVGERIGDSRNLGETHHWTGIQDAGIQDAGIQDERPAAATRTHEPGRQSPRFMLWIDAVGGYLVCLGDEIIVGQAHPNAQVDVPIQADISRRHVKLRRVGEGYVIEPLAPNVTLADRPLTRPALLSDGDEIGLNGAVRLRFRKPHVLSASARLEIVSKHRTHPFADAVLLMAESCVLGPKWQNHVVCREWGGDVVLYRQDDRIFCRAMESIEIDGKLHDGRGPVRPGSQVLGTDFSMTLEAV